MKKAVEVSVLGQSFTVKSEASPDYVNRVASYVDGKLRSLQGQAKTSSTLNIALLACMNLADELFQAREGQVVEKNKIQQRVDQLMAMIDSQLEAL